MGKLQGIRTLPEACLMWPVEYISKERITERIDRLGEIGRLPGGGIQRLSFTVDDQAARELVAKWLSDSGLEVRLDGAGNLTGRLEGSDPGAPILMAGSHLDSQPNAGRFDGVVGVVSALEVIDAMRQSGWSPRHPIEIVAWAGEESGARFDISMIGSRAMVGAVGLHNLEARCRLTGITLKQAMGSVGINVSALPAAARPPGSIKAVIELHIEQGPRLERARTSIGVVTDIAGFTRFQCVLTGQQAHSGASPMESRRDALCGAAEVILVVETLAKRSPAAVTGTVGFLEYEPRAVAVVPGKVKMIIDVRSAGQAECNEVVKAVERRAAAIAASRNLDLNIGEKWGSQAAKLDASVVDIISKACEDLQIPHIRLTSGAAHDSLIMSGRFPTGMIFVPSAQGISHAPEEFTEIDDLEAGARVLCRTMCELSG